MASATISSLGVGSGLDLQTLYTNLENAEKTKLTTITNQQTSYNAQLSAFSKLQSAMQTLNTATAALSKTDTWNATAVGSTNNSFTQPQPRAPPSVAIPFRSNRWQKRRC